MSRISYRTQDEWEKIIIKMVRDLDDAPEAQRARAMSFYELGIKLNYFTQYIQKGVSPENAANLAGLPPKK